METALMMNGARNVRIINARGIECREDDMYCPNCGRETSYETGRCEWCQFGLGGIPKRPESPPIPGTDAQYDPPIAKGFSDAVKAMGLSLAMPGMGLIRYGHSGLGIAMLVISFFLGMATLTLGIVSFANGTIMTSLYLLLTLLITVWIVGAALSYALVRSGR